MYERFKSQSSHDGWGTFLQVPIFALADIIFCVSYFLKLISSKKSTHLRRNPSTHSTSSKKIHLFLQNFVEDYILHISCSNFHFLDLFLSNSFCCKFRLCAIKFGADCTLLYMLGVLFRFCTYNDV